jgi:DNA-binding XRE family transcriptional regulator
MRSIQQLRVDAGWTQADLAEEAQVDTRTIKRWEAEEVPPRRVQLLYERLFSAETEQDQDDEDGLADPPDGPVPLSEVVQIRPEPLDLEGKLAPILGSIPSGRAFSILLSGASGAGKSSVAMMIASMLSEHGSVLYATAEERLDSGTISIRAEQVGVVDADLDVAEVRSVREVDEHLQAFDYSFCVLDSINELELDPATMIDLMSNHRDVSWVLIAQADATEKGSMGGARWRHLVDIRLWCERAPDGTRIVRNLKNRFAPQLDELVLSGPTRPPKRERKKVASQSIATQPHEEPMVDHSTWLISRLESELAALQRKVDKLEDQLAQRDEELRRANLRLTRYEVRDELNDAGGKQSLSDRMNPESFVELAEKLQPYASIIGDVVKGLVLKGQAPASASPPATPMTYQPYETAVPHTGVTNLHPFDFDVPPGMPETNPPTNQNQPRGQQ